MRQGRSLAAVAMLACTLVATVAPARANHSVIEHVSQGAIGGNGAGAGVLNASTDGSVVVFTTSEQLVAADTDAAVDIYRRAGGTTELVVDRAGEHFG